MQHEQKIEGRFRKIMSVNVCSIFDVEAFCSEFLKRKIFCTVPKPLIHRTFSTESSPIFVQVNPKNRRISVLTYNHLFSRKFHASSKPWYHLRLIAVLSDASIKLVQTTFSFKYPYYNGKFKKHYWEVFQIFSSDKSKNFSSLANKYFPIAISICLF